MHAVKISNNAILKVISHERLIHVYWEVLENKKSDDWAICFGLTIESVVTQVVVEPSMSASYEQVSLYVCVPLLCLSSLKLSFRVRRREASW